MAKVQVENIHFQIEKDEKELTHKIETVEREVPEEARVHEALMSFLDQSCVDLEKKINEWDETFLKDTTAKRQELDQWHEKLGAKQKELQDLNDKFVDPKPECFFVELVVSSIFNLTNPIRFLSFADLSAFLPGTAPSVSPCWSTRCCRQRRSRPARRATWSTGRRARSRPGGGAPWCGRA